MKFKIEVGLDELTETGEGLEETIIQRVADKIGSIDLKEKIDAKINTIISDKVISRIDEILKKMTDELFEKEIEITDSWGKIISKGTIRSIVNKRFEEYLLQDVDKEGKPSNGYSSTKFTRTEYFIKQILNSEMDSFTKRTALEVQKAVKAKLTEDLQLAVGNEIVNSLGVKNILDRLQLPQKK